MESSLETLIRAREIAARATRAGNRWMTGGVSSRSQPADRAVEEENPTRSSAPEGDATTNGLCQIIPVESLGAGVVNTLGDAVTRMVTRTQVEARSDQAMGFSSGVDQVWYGVGQVVRGATGVVVGLLGCLGCVAVCMGKTIIGSSGIRYGVVNVHHK
ncbi:MAG: hypothetical protein H7839_00375 [Magnetococcus sp. YQC-5]